MLKMLDDGMCNLENGDEVCHYSKFEIPFYYSRIFITRFISTKNQMCEMYGQINIEFFLQKIVFFLIEIRLYKSASDFMKPFFDCLMFTVMSIKKQLQYI